jgi:hypothetical protein
VNLVIKNLCCVQMVQCTSGILWSGVHLVIKNLLLRADGAVYQWHTVERCASGDKEPVAVCIWCSVPVAFCAVCVTGDV